MKTLRIFVLLGFLAAMTLAGCKKNTNSNPAPPVPPGQPGGPAPGH